MGKKNKVSILVPGTNKKRAPQLQKPRRKSWTKMRRENFLTELATTANVRAAARAANMCPQAAYKLRNRDPGFYREWLDALTQGYEQLELMLLEQAMYGLEEDVWYSGAIVGTKRRHSDVVALTLYRAHRETVLRRRSTDEPEEIRTRLATKLLEMKSRLSANDK